MRPFIAPALVFLVLLLPRFAWGAAIVVGAGIGRECYEQTLLEPSPMRNAAALEICDRAVSDYAVNAYNRTAAFANRADIRLRMQDFTGAVRDADQAIRVMPELGVGHLNRGAGLIGLQRYDEALASLNRAIALRVGKLQLAYYDRAMTKELLGDIKGAYLDYRQASQLDPAFDLAREQLVRFTVTRKPDSP